MKESSPFVLDPIPGASTPWGMNPDQVFQSVAEQIHVDALALGVFDGQRLRPDEFLVAKGWSDERAALLSDPQAGHQQLLRAAFRQGIALSGPSDTIGEPLRNQYALVVASPESFFEHRWWCLLLTRKTGPFTENEQRQADLILRKWQSTFATDTEPGMGRLIVGHDDRLIAADLGLRMRLLRDPELLPRLLGLIKPIVEQRWPTLALQTTRDLAVSLDEHVLWINFRNNRGLAQPESEHRYIEVRPLQKDELIPVGIVEDPRIAQALAYLHENYHRAPSLAQVARAVHVSPFHFHRLFTRQVGLSPKQYLLRKQLQVAKWLLRATRESIGSIAQQTGFASHGHFTSTFRRFVGLSPSQYRERH